MGGEGVRHLLSFSTVGEELDLLFLCLLRRLQWDREEEEEVCESRSTTCWVDSWEVEPEAGETAQLNKAAI